MKGSMTVHQGRGAILKGHISASLETSGPDYKEIALVPLNVGFAIIDAEDLELVSGYHWYFLRASRGNAYAVANITKPDGRGALIYMHRLIAKTPEGKDTDHRDGNGLHNCKSNLRTATTAQNGYNSRVRINKRHSRFKGVDKKNGKWRAQIRINGKKTHIGLFDTEEEAALAYDLVSFQYFGEYANNNNIRGLMSNGTGI